MLDLARRKGDHIDEDALADLASMKDSEVDGQGKTWL